ncbi:deuterolysin M35 metalloprotease [Crepidotus variabilis]|uniref:Deuterolysin M35 metalloprotease n=1 Tax=Crepidotus variabilis TaxID=179855 RepID=A0A9P6EHP1_9AGAR|nr:deuterolysin M35 metalloprotease [Crepidotus variabilis]
MQRPSCYVLFGPTTFDDVDTVSVITTLTNTGLDVFKIFNDPNGPLSTLPTDNFVITNVFGTTPTFTGVNVKYVYQTAAAHRAFTVLAPGQSVNVKHNLYDAYDFTNSGTGIYNIQPKNRFHIVEMDSTIKEASAHVTTNHSAILAGKLAVRRTLLEPRATYVGCSSSQQSALVLATSAAQSYASSAYPYLTSHTNSTLRYTTWFGTYASSRHSIVVSHFSKISGSSFSSFNYDCTCTDPGTIAYIYPDTSGTIYLCSAFWEAPTTGSDSKGGILIYESAQFTANGGAQNYVYGVSATKALAAGNPDRAVGNSLSYECFAENNPPLP